MYFKLRIQVAKSDDPAKREYIKHLLDNMNEEGAVSLEHTAELFDLMNWDGRDQMEQMKKLFPNMNPDGTVLDHGTEEDEAANINMPNQYRCDACRIISMLITVTLQAKIDSLPSVKSGKKELSESDVIDILDLFCNQPQDNFKKFVLQYVFAEQGRLFVYYYHFQPLNGSILIKYDYSLVEKVNIEQKVHPFLERCQVG